MADNETIADIIAEMRAADNKCQLATKDGTGCYHCPFGSAASNCVFDNYADRLDAAHKRELAVYVLAIAKLRGALKKVRLLMPYFLQYMRLRWEDAGGGGYYESINRTIDAALAAPPRNCDCFKTAAEAAHKRERGDAAKLREALESIAYNLEHRLFARYPSSASDEWMYQKANAALAATEKEGGAK